MNLRGISIQVRLTLLVLGTVLLFGLIAGYASYQNTQHETEEIFDAQLAQFAHNLMVVASHSDRDEDQVAPMPQHTHKYQHMLVFQVWNTDRAFPRLLLRSNNISDMAIAQMPAEGYSSGEWHGEHWRFFRQRDEARGFDVLVGQNDEAREEMAREVAMHNLTPFLFGLPLLAFFAILAIRLGLRPLRDLTGSLHQLGPDQLAPVTLHDIPQEIAPVVEELNKLLLRISRAMENERRFTADASHELRTPLAALHAQIQAAQFSGSAEERKESLAKALRGAERMAHLVGQLLTLSRLDEVSAPAMQERVALDALVQECCAEAGADALAKDIEISLVHDGGNTCVIGSTDMLHILLRNLLDNAIRYTPHGGRVAITLRPAPNGQVELEIEDSGSGVAEEQLALLGQRFNRLSPQATDGVGLGLSIVQRIAEIHRARLSFARAALGGLGVKTLFPPCAG